MEAVRGIRGRLIQRTGSAADLRLGRKTGKTGRRAQWLRSQGAIQPGYDQWAVEVCA